ncbi:hypothetical protein T11_9832 [Trichinella zimbabwensis]|uniref:Uncharacterized protein n=1 Tax=Trichinella zimbabwensis TaxID=268475 RepID=A0A0V1HHH0_9BILA|nr:hypothetical protein T11_9832 [Trichinella zimbabwensis]
MDCTENHQETFYQSALKNLKLDDHQLDDYEKQVKPNEGLEKTKQDEQAMKTDAENNANDVIENDNELSVTGSEERSMGDEEMDAGKCVINMNADKMNEGVFDGSPDGNEQSHSRDEVPKQYDAEYEITNEQTNENLDTAQNGVLSDEIHCDCEIPHINPYFLLLRLMLQTHSFEELFAPYPEIRSDQSEESIVNSKDMDCTENHQETFYQSALKNLKLDDHQLDDYEKQVKPNEGLEKTKQDEQAMKTDAENNANDVIENDNELSVTGSEERSMGDEEMDAGKCVINMNADKMNEGVFDGSPDGNEQSHSRDEVPKQYDAEYEITNEQTNENLDTAQNGVLSDEIHCDCEIPHINPYFLLLRLMLQTHSFEELFAPYPEIRSDQSEECENP